MTSSPEHSAVVPIEWTPTPTPTPPVQRRASSRVGPPLPVFAQGDMIGPLYRVVRLIGIGSVGEVYEVEHVDLGQRYAIKVLSDESEAQPVIRKRFEREARIAASIDHPNVLRVVNLDVLPWGRRFIVSELLRGRTLAERLANGRLPIGEACWIAEQIAMALHAAHARGVIHRDLKPSNVFLVDTDGLQQVKVLDFGIAKVPRSEADLTAASVVLGTLGYAAPEQIVGDAGLDARADLYSLGVILYEMLTGAPPFVDGDAQSLLMAHLEGPAPDPRARREHIPTLVAQITHACLAKDPASRPQSAKEVHKLLRAFRKHATQRHAQPRPRYERWLIAAALMALAFSLPVLIREIARGF